MSATPPQSGEPVQQGDDPQRRARVARCRGWNASRAHQQAAGRARATAFTAEYQAAAGQRSFDAMSARFRAEAGLRPLSGAAVSAYVSPEQIRGALGRPLPGALQRIVHTAWRQGFGADVSYWLSPAGTMSGMGEGDPWDGSTEDFGPPLPPGTLFTQATALSDGDDSIGEPLLTDHTWQTFEPGWLVCQDCWQVAICPACLARAGEALDHPSAIAEVLRRLPQICCETHGSSHSTSAG